MRNRPIVTHLIDDTTAGGVMRVLDYIRTSSKMARLADHRFETVTRGQIHLRRHAGDIVVSHLTLSWRALPALLALRLANRGKTLVHVEHSYTEGFVRHNVPHLHRFLALLRFGFSCFDAIVAVSHAQADWLRRARLCRDSKIFEIRSCVDLSAFQARRKEVASPRTVGAIGRLDRQKGFDTLIRGFRRLPHDDIALHIYGTGAELESLQALAGGDPRIVFKGFTDSPAQAYADVDVVVIPSRWEAYGLVAIEALCAGCHVLSADVDGLRDHQDYGAHNLADTSEDGITRSLEDLVSGKTVERAVAPDAIATHAETAFVAGWAKLIEVMQTEDRIAAEPQLQHG